MPRDGTETRARIMDVAESLILAQGFAATSVDSIVAGAGVTKGAFFHHFDTKTELAHALVERWADRDEAHLEENMERAERLSRDPLQQLLLFVGLFEESMAALTEPYPGCLLASTVHEAELFDGATRARIRRSVHAWRGRIRAKLDEVAVEHPARLDVDLDAVADQMWSTFEGAFILSKTLQEAGPVAAQLRQYRNYLELLFEDA
ncbi:MAG: TetR/AcrR family transcriptional regulator [Candidatus Longimicrobiales bacterium M2_2A_002]